MNVHTIVDGRLVDEPRTFTTKDGKELLSVRVADNAFGDTKKFEPMFVSFVLSEGLAKVVKERGLTKGDVVTVSGDLRIRLFEQKGGKGKKGPGISYEIPFVQSFRIQRCAADSREPEPSVEPEEVALDDGDPFED